MCVHWKAYKLRIDIKANYINSSLVNAVCCVSIQRKFPKEKLVLRFSQQYVQAFKSAVDARNRRTPKIIFENLSRITQVIVLSSDETNILLGKSLRSMVRYSRSSNLASGI